MPTIESLHPVKPWWQWPPAPALIPSNLARAVRDGMLWLVPYLMLWSAVLIVAEVLRLGGWQPEWATLLEAAATSLRQALPMAMWGSLGAMCAVQRHLPRSAVAFICLACGVVLQALLARQGRSAEAFYVPLAIVGPLVTVPLLARLMRLRWTRLAAHGTDAGQNVSDALNLVLPALLATALMAAALQALVLLATVTPVTGLADVMRELSPVARAALYCLMNSVLWSVGVHGYYALLPLLETIPALQSADTGSVSQSFLGLYVFIGGSGATASLILAILAVGRVEQNRLIALASLAPALLNVNELLLFGLPLIFNARLFAPFLLVPLANLALATTISQAGWVAPAAVELPFNSPVLLNAVIATGGDRGAILLQMLNVLVGAVIYGPFVMAWERRLVLRRDRRLSRIDTSFSQRREEAEMVLDDPIGEFRRTEAEQVQLRSRMRELGNYEFALEFQPKVSPLTGRITGCEALLRLEDGHGRLLSPHEFLPDLERAHLMKEVDLWVMAAASDQIDAWRADGVRTVEVAVNVCVDSLGDRAVVNRLADLVARHPGLLIVEITEQSLLGDEASTQWALERLRSAGARIHIDDFGTGYSSLSYLHRFAVDGIKIDRSFTRALDQDRGRRIFAALCALARELHLEIVVEGLENGWQLRHLPADHDVLVQGWYYARAMSAERFVDNLRNGLAMPLEPAPA